jgi:CheY-like chemotaxis protein
LYISKELTEKMAGEIGVMSQPGEGSRFVFYIKTRRAEAPQQDLPVSINPVLAMKELILSPHRSMITSAKTEKLRVLLVEDNLINQRVLRKHLAKSGCEVDVANHGVEALDILAKKTTGFDVILMDMQMPVMDGLTCTVEIRNLEHAGQLEGRRPIIAVTANVRQEQMDSALRAGADRVMQKPFKAADLIKLIWEVIEENGRANVDVEKEDNGQPQDMERSSSESSSVSLPGTTLTTTSMDDVPPEPVGEIENAKQNSLTQN